MQGLLAKGTNEVCGCPHDAKLTTDTYKNLAGCELLDKVRILVAPRSAFWMEQTQGGKGRVADWGIYFGLRELGSGQRTREIGTAASSDPLPLVIEVVSFLAWKTNPQQTEH